MPELPPREWWWDVAGGESVNVWRTVSYDGGELVQEHSAGWELRQRPLAPGDRMCGARVEVDTDQLGVLVCNVVGDDHGHDAPHFGAPDRCVRGICGCCSKVMVTTALRRVR